MIASFAGRRRLFPSQACDDARADALVNRYFTEFDLELATHLPYLLFTKPKHRAHVYGAMLLKNSQAEDLVFTMCQKPAQRLNVSMALLQSFITEHDAVGQELG
ncbi:hypothetical protein [Stutzerimonas stutzeri]|uniref:hypothetical protein n=1 Tax=Stutzerimonas stutzeri TaxID=316 RepID=UPI0015E2C357|nr:hypothetical protein [Stutzerimonas stutzeri]MBA1265095.1 hypothetical protein [Stutzerimonas stutzeri]